MANIWEDLYHFLEQYSADPVAYAVLFYLYCIAATVILPIPVEIGLLLNPGTPFIIKALILGAGKATGSVLVFYIGTRVEVTVRRWQRWNWFSWLVEKSELLVEKAGYVGLYILLSIPGMVDTIPIYIFSVFNREGKVLELKYFALVNFLGGITRAFLLFVLLEFFGIHLFG